MTIDVEFIVLKIIVHRKVRSWKQVSQSRSAREETIRIELKVTFINFGSPN